LKKALNDEDIFTFGGKLFKGKEWKDLGDLFKDGKKKN